ncbi:MAG: hypothetical protein AAF212_01140 [Verrucomicrobiota bacterium]
MKVLKQMQRTEAYAISIIAEPNFQEVYPFKFTSNPAQNSQNLERIQISMVLGTDTDPKNTKMPQEYSKGIIDFA